MFHRVVAVLAAMAAFGSAVMPAAEAGTLDDVKKKGVLVVGVKTDYPPWGGRDAAGNAVGMEADMAADVAKRLGVKLELVPVVSSNRMQFLQQGKIDLMIATMSVNEERKKVVGIVEPLYYASGVAMLANKSVGIKSVADLKGKPVCAVQGAFYNREISEKYTGTELVAFKAVTENEQALSDKRCVAFVYDDVILVYKKNSEADRWKDFDLVAIPEIPALPWGLAVRLEELNEPWGKFMSDTVKDWLKTGFLLQLEKKWVGSNTDWLVKASAAQK